MRKLNCKKCELLERALALKEKTIQQLERENQALRNELNLKIVHKKTIQITSKS